MAADLEEDDRDPLTRIAALVADGQTVDWEGEAAKTPALADEIRLLHWIESITQVPRESAAHEAGPSGAPDDGPLAPGDRWGTLEIRERIGRGAAGDVYRAFDPALEREVALKIWREDALHRTTGTEARRLRRIEHPAVLKVLGVERHDGLAGMWTDFVAGRNLEEILAESGPLSVAEACRIGMGVCDALEAVHAGRMVHRDVKASNVMWLSDDSVVLIDLGSAKELPRGVPEHSEHIRGAPLGAAPEVLRGGAIGPAADVFSLGVLLYRLVSGKYPIEAATYMELFAAIDAGRLVPLLERSPGCDPAFATIVDRALAPEPAGRPGLRALREALARIAG